MLAAYLKKGSLGLHLMKDIDKNPRSSRLVATTTA
jgi:hypothetical protein